MWLRRLGAFFPQIPQLSFSSSQNLYRHCHIFSVSLPPQHPEQKGKCSVSSVPVSKVHQEEHMFWSSFWLSFSAQKSFTDQHMSAFSVCSKHANVAACFGALLSLCLLKIQTWNTNFLCPRCRSQISNNRSHVRELFLASFFLLKMHTLSIHVCFLYLLKTI